jgi:hypothetical protein
VTKTEYIEQVYTIDTMNGTTYHAMCEHAHTVVASEPRVLTPCICTTKVAGTIPGKFNGTTFRVEDHRQHRTCCFWPRRLCFRGCGGGLLLVLLPYGS